MRNVTWVTAALALLALLAAAPAVADTGDIIEGPANGKPESPDNGWQAGVCVTDTPECSVEQPEEFFTQAAAHPNVGFTQFIVKHTAGLLGPAPVGEVKDLRVDLPVGLSVNPTATPRCTAARFEAESCPADTEVGTSALTLVAAGVEVPPIEGLSKVPVYNLVPEAGHPALFAFTAAGQHVYLKSDVDWAGDYHEGFTIAVPKSPLGELLKNRLIFNGRAGNGAFLTNPSTCLDPAVSPNQHVYSTLLRADSVAEPDPSFPAGSSFFESPLPTGVMPTGCASVPFEPAVSIDGNGAATDSPSGPTVTLSMPFHAAGDAINSSNVRDAAVAMPTGTGLNPAAAPKLGFCTDAQFGKGTTAPIACPASSKVGTAAIETPPLPAGSLTGNVYLGSQLSREPESGREYRIFVDAASSRYGVDARLVGDVVADARTGRLTAVFRENPQVPLTSVSLNFDPGLGALSSSPVCVSSAASTITPYSGTAVASPVGTLTLTRAPGGGPCAKTMAERPFAPGFLARPDTSKVLTYTPYELRIAREDGRQELKGFDVTLPSGATAKLASVPYCEPREFGAAAARSGAEEARRPSCRAASRIGVATVLVGTGPAPLRVGGTAYLSGPYQGAPLSIVVITPAVAGPFDLGNVVVRAALDVGRETGQASASAEIPDVFGGAKLDVRSILVRLDRHEFTLNGTNCKKSAVAGVVRGGGADPTDPAAWSAVPVSSPARGDGCRALKFRPKLNLRLFGQTHRAQHPKLRATLKTKPGQANVAFASVALPHAIFLDQSSLGTVCTRPQFAAERCPKKSVYGHARAFSPLLSKPLKGPVVLRSSNHELPDLVAHLRGQVTIDLDGRIDSYKGGIRTTFAHVPDLPVTKFVLLLPGGKHGLLQASTNLCARPVRGIIRLTAQNSRRANRRATIRTPCEGGHRKRRQAKRS